MPPELAGLGHDPGGVLDQRRDHQDVRLQPDEGGELGVVVAIRLGEGLRAEDLHAHGVERALHDVVAGLREGVVVPVEHARGLEAELPLGALQGAGDHLPLGERDPPDVVTDVGDALGSGVRDRDHRDLGGLRQGVCGGGGVGERGADDGAHLVLADEALVDGDALLLGGGVVLDHGLELHPPERAAPVDLVHRRQHAGLLLRAVDGGRPGEAQAGADLDGGLLGGRGRGRGRGDGCEQDRESSAREAHGGSSWLPRKVTFVSQRVLRRKRPLHRAAIPPRPRSTPGCATR